MKSALASLLVGAALLAPMTAQAQAITADSHSTTSSFAIRGLKGLWWEGIEKYYKAVPWMADHNMNWLMLCYTAYPESGREWRKDYTDQHLAEMKELVTRGNDKGVTICLSFNPGIWSDPPLCHSSEQDYQAAWRKVKDAHEIGIYWIALCLDDISRELVPADKEKYGSLQEAQVDFVNRIWKDMKQLSPQMRLIFCPSAYTTEDMKAHMDYTLTVGAKIDPAIDVFWTGPTVCSETITVADANEVAGWLKRQPFIWDNYPVNDMFPWRPLLAPLDGRDSDLAGAVSGIVFNPMKQWEANKIPLVSVAAYLNNPAEYDPAQMEDKVLAQYKEADRPGIQLLLKYYGSAFIGEKNYPPGPQIDDSNRAPVLAELKQIREILSKGAPEMQALWADVKETVEADIRNLELLAEGPVFYGKDMTGGAPELAEKGFGQRLAVVYAEPTGKSDVTTTLTLSNAASLPSRLRLLARNGDGKKPKIRISLNDKPIVAGETEFSQSDFEAREFPIPANAFESGTAVLKIDNLESTGTAGMPPWFAVKWVQLLN